MKPATLLVLALALVMPRPAGAQCRRRVRVGVLGEFKRPTAGTTQPFGAEIAKGVEVGLAELRESPSSVCIDTELIDIDNSIADVPDLIRRSARDKGIRVFLGLGTSNQALAAADALRETRSILFTPTASSERLLGADKRTILLFPRNRQIADFIAARARANGARRVAVVFGSNSVYSRDMAALFAERFEARGGTVVRSIPIRLGNFSLGRKLEELRKDDYTDLFLPLYELDVAKVIAALKEAGVRKRFIGSDSWGTYSDVIKSMSDGKFEALLPTVYNPSLDYEQNRRFVARYKARFGGKPTDLSAFSYDGIRLIRSFLEACPRGSGERGEIESCLDRALPFAGVTGTVTAQRELALQRPLTTMRLWRP